MENHSNKHIFLIVPLLNLYDSVYTVYRTVRNDLAEWLGAENVHYQSTCDEQSRCQHTGGMLLRKAYPRTLFEFLPCFSGRQNPSHILCPWGWEQGQCIEAIFQDSDNKQRISHNSLGDITDGDCWLGLNLSCGLVLDPDNAGLL